MNPEARRAVSVATVITSILLPAAIYAQGVADGFPLRAFTVEGGLVSVRGGVMRDPSRQPKPMGKLRYPSVHFVVMTNETSAPLWAEVEIKPPKEKTKPRFWGPLPEGKEGIWQWESYDSVWAEPIPIRISVFGDENRSKKLGEKTMTMYLGEDLKTTFHDPPRVEGGRTTVVALSGWREMSRSLCTNKGTAADEELLWDICRQIWKQESIDRLECEHPVQSVRKLDVTKSALVSGLPEDLRASVDELLANGGLLIEEWTVKSCETSTAYEVLLHRHSAGGTDILAAPVRP